MDLPAAGRPPTAAPPAGVARLLVGSVAVTIILFVVPFGDVIGRPLVLVSTLLHELGHGAAAAAVGGDVLSVEVEGDASGQTTSRVPVGRIRRATVAAGGLLGPAVGAALLFAASRRPRGARAAAVAGGVVLLIATLLVVRGAVGIGIALLLAGLLLAAGVGAGGRAAQAVLAFLGVQMALSVFSRGDYLFARSAGSGPSDVQQIAQALFLPWFVWGALCGLASVAVLALGLVLLLRPHGSTSP